MGIDVMLADVGGIARPQWSMYEWLNNRMQDYNIRYGWIELSEEEVWQLAKDYVEDPVGRMLVKRVAEMKEKGGTAPYTLELFISI